MKTKKTFAALLAVLLVAALVMSVSATSANDVMPEASTEVTANITDPGNVSYVITIPDSADFGTLTLPDSIENDNYTFYDFQIEATDLNIRSNQAVTVYVKDSSAGDDQFYISQKDAETPFKIKYDVYDTLVNAENIDSYDAINAPSNTPGSYGYHLCTFPYGTDGDTQQVTLALNQNALYGQTISDIAGSYSGTITFHTALVEIVG